MEYVREFMRRYRGRTARSRELAGSRHALARPPRPLGFDPRLKEICYPIAATTFRGSAFLDVDGNDYLDFAMAFGSALFGHNPDFLREALATQLELGFGVGPEGEPALEVAGRIAALTGAERVAFACSGTEAVMVALRLARTVSLRERIVIFSGSYHGQCDATLARADVSAAQTAGIPFAAGIPRSVAGNVIVLAYGSEESLAVIGEHRDELAAVLVEPVQSQRPELQPRSFLRQLRRLTAESGIALVFDEMMTGFRLARGGAQAHFGMRADLSIYGKVIAGGMPLAAVAGDARYLNAIDGGPWRFGDDSFPAALTTYTGSSFAHHPLSLAASRAVLARLDASGPALQEELNDRTAALVARLNSGMVEAGAPLRWAACGSYFAPAQPADETSLAMQLLHYQLAASGVYLWGTRGFLATTHTAEAVDRLCDAVAASVRSLVEAGHIPGCPDAPDTARSDA